MFIPRLMHYQRTIDQPKWYSKPTATTTIPLGQCQLIGNELKSRAYLTTQITWSAASNDAEASELSTDDVK
jgi:hypothetical protein